MGARPMGLSLSTALRLGRVSNLPTVWTNVLAGVALSGAAATGGALAALMVALSLFYVVLIAVVILAAGYGVVWVSRRWSVRRPSDAVGAAPDPRRAPTG